MKTSFWTYFTSGYGIIWMLLLVVSFLSGSYIDAGVFGLVGFPIIAVVYACVRRSSDAERLKDVVELRTESPRMTEFLDAYPEFRDATPKMRADGLNRWVNDESLHDLQERL